MAKSKRSSKQRTGKQQPDAKPRSEKRKLKKRISKKRSSEKRKPNVDIAKRKTDSSPTHIQVNSDDYVLLDVGKAKPKLAMVLGSKGNRAILEDGVEQDDADQVTFEPEQVVANLGRVPKTGRYCGVLVEPFRTAIHSSNWGPIYIYRRMKKVEKRRLFDSLSECHTELKKRASTGFLPLHATKIRPKRGKMAGQYTYKNKQDVRMDTLELYPLTFEDVQYNKYIIYHECGHGIWYRQIPTSIKSKWIRLYSRRVALKKVTSITLITLFDNIAEYENTLRDYVKEIADERDKVLIKECLRYMKQKRHLGVQEIETLIEQDTVTIKKLWPSVSSIDKLDVDVTEYAMTSCYEFFAECFAFHMEKKRLPKDVSKLMKLTMSKLMKY